MKRAPAAGRGRRRPSTRTVPRWLTSNTTAPVRQAGVLGDGARRVRQRHVPAAELGELGARGRGGRRRAARCGSSRPRSAGDAASGGAGDWRRRRRPGRAVAERHDAGVEVGLALAEVHDVEDALALLHEVEQLAVVEGEGHRASRRSRGWREAMSSPTRRRSSAKTSRTDLELDAGVEQLLDDPQLEQVAVGVQAPAAAAAWRRRATGGSGRCGPSSRAGGR